jgi:RNA polymerase sigma-70 factor (ECF subfamily)
VLLRTVLGLDASSAGRVLGKRPGAVRMSAHRGLRNLARQLDARQARSQAAPGGVTAAEPDALNGLS